MDSFETLVIEELERAAGGPPFDAKQMLAGVATARWRRRTGAAIGAALALVVLAGTGTGAVLAAKHDHARPGTRTSPASPSPSASIVAEPAPLPGESYWMGASHSTVGPLQGSFYDAQHGFLLVARCQLTDEVPCNGSLVYTADGGRTWQDRTLPVRSRFVFDTVITAVGAESVVADRQAFNDLPHRRFLSTDSGQSWRELLGDQSLFRAALPDDAVAVVGNAVAAFGGWFNVLASDGTSYALQGPDVDRADSISSAALAPDGTLFAVGQTSLAVVDGSVVVPAAPVVNVSTDRGRTWQRRAGSFPPPKGRWYACSASLMALDGHTLYLKVDYCQYDQWGGTVDAPSVIKLYRSLDGGASWRDVALPRLDPRFDAETLYARMVGYQSFDATGRYVSMAATPDGLLLTYGGRLYRLARGDSAFREVAEVAGGLWLLPLGPSSLVLGVDVQGQASHQSDVFSLTGDGTSWSRISLR